MTCIVEIISIGNELLIGKILNTNAQWLANYITTLGGKVRRINTVGDIIPEIASTIQDAIHRNPTLIITTGGLGPTFDDKTLESIAMALKRPLELNEEALVMINERYCRYNKIAMRKIDLTPARLKMAYLPRGAVPLPNSLGTAPGVYFDHRSSKIIALPGVPKEMKVIFEKSVVPMIREYVGNLFIYRKSVKVTGIIESDIAPLIDVTMRDNHHIYIKSHPKDYQHLELYFTTTSNSQEEAKKIVEKAINKISSLIIEHGGKIGEI